MIKYIFSQVENMDKEKEQSDGKVSKTPYPYEKAIWAGAAGCPVT